MVQSERRARSAGVLGVGVHLPPAVRTNNWWPADVVARWAAAQARGLEALADLPVATEGARRTVAALRAAGGDPFDGVRERRVLAPDRTSADMEEDAARTALARAGLEPADLDALLVHTEVPERLLSNTGCELHHRLGLPAACLTVEAHASSYAFLAQLSLAAALVETGRARAVLLVQSAAPSRLIDPADPLSSRFGDAASAVVVGPVGAGAGLLAAVHRTEGSHPHTLVASPPGGRWYEGPSRLHSAEPAALARAFLSTVDQCSEVIDAALAAAGCRAEDVGLLAVHQGRPWMLRLVQEQTGLGHARAIDLLPRVGHVFAASLPLVLDAALAQGALADGDLVVLLAGGTGITYGASVVRWGRGAP